MDNFLLVLLVGALLGAVALGLSVYAVVRTNPQYRRLRKAGMGRMRAVQTLIGGGGGPPPDP
jgi:heme A synthase